MIRVAVQTDDIDVASEFAALEGEGAGAVATFVGRVRADDGVTMLSLEHYPGMTEAALHELAVTANARWRLLASTIVHRVGNMLPQDRIVFVGTSAPHRHDALAACAFLIDRLKTDAPFWKRETRGGKQRWVQGRAEDDAAARRWG